MWGASQAAAGFSPPPSRPEGRRGLRGRPTFSSLRCGHMAMWNSLAVAALWSCFLGAARAEEQEVASLLKQFTTAYHLVEENSAEPVIPEQAFYAGAIPGLL